MLDHYIRPLDWDKATEYEGGYRNQILHHNNRSMVSVSLVPAGHSGPPRHIHTSDQTYMVIKGETTIELGDEVHTVAAGRAIFIPAGVPHRNWNASDSEEIHIDVLTPGFEPDAPVVIPADDPDTKGLPFYVTDEAAPKETPFQGFRIHWLTDYKSGARTGMINIAEVDPGGGSPPTHIHGFDQYYFVLEGTLSIQMGLDQLEAGPNTLVVVPAGVPHKQWNEGDVMERHMTVNAPSPPKYTSPEDPWDVGVDFGPSGAAH